MTSNHSANNGLPGFQLENFRFLSVLGHGGMGTVYLAEQLRPRRHVAIKVVAPNPEIPPAFFDTLKGEGDVAARFSHDNLVHVYECGIVDEHYFLAMEYLGGGDLGQKIRNGINPDEAIKAIRAIASALSHIHSRGYVHRDVKPSNILFTEANKPVLVDFGVARVACSVGHLTSAGFATGTPAYMSPEQIRGRELDGRSDLYSLGVVFYQALTGRLPFQGDTSQDLQLAHLSEPPRPLPETLALFQPVVSRLLAKKPKDRFPDAHALIGALESLQLERQSGLTQSGPTKALGLHRWGRELVRRKVLRTVAVYVAGGWGFTEIATAALEAFGLPERWGEWLVIVFIAAFPLVVALSWMYEARSGGPVRDQRAAPKRMLWWTTGGGLLVALLVLVPIIRKVPEPPPVLVRPFDLAIVRGQSSGEHAGVLLEGLVGDLERSLSARSDLRLFGSASAERLLQDNAQASQSLPVAKLVEISAQQVGDQIRLRVSMKAADSGKLLWAESLDDRIDDFFELQDRLTQRLLPRLNANLEMAPETEKPDLQAYLAFQRARQRAAGGSREDLLAALEHAKQAIALDPGYPEAKALLGNLYLDLVEKYPIRDASVRLEMDKFLEEARAIARELGDRFPESVRLSVRLEMESYQRHDQRGWPPREAILPVPGVTRLESAIGKFPDAAALYPLAAFARLAAASPDPERWPEARADARDLLARTLARHPTDLELALAYAAYGEDEIEQLTRLVGDYPNQVLPLQRLGWAHYNAGALAYAAQHWAAAYVLDPEMSAGRLNLLRVLIDLRAVDPATALIERYFDDTQLDSEFYLLAAAEQLAQGQPEMAGILLNLAAEKFALADRPMPCLAALAGLWSGAPPDRILSMEPAELARCGEHLLQRFGDSLTLHRALALRVQGQAAAAAEALGDLASVTAARLSLRPDPADFHLQSAVLAASGDLQAALAALDRAERYGWSRYWYSRWHPALLELNADPQFALLLRGIEARVNQQRRLFELDAPTQGSLNSANLTASSPGAHSSAF